MSLGWEGKIQFAALQEKEIHPWPPRLQSCLRIQQVSSFLSSFYFLQNENISHFEGGGGEREREREREREI